MRNRLIALLAVLLIALLGAAASGVSAQPPTSSSFNYQGTLAQGGAPASGSFDFRFILYDAATGGTQVGTTLTREDVTVARGLFVVTLDFGPVFDNSTRYLELGVRPGGSAGEYTTLSPRQALLAVPASVYSRSTGALQGRAVSAAAPSAGQALKWNGSAWAPAADSDTTYAAGAGLNLVGATFSVLFAGSGGSSYAARADHNHFGETWIGTSASYGLWLQNSSAAPGLIGRSDSGRGLEGQGAAVGVIGFGLNGGRGLEGQGSTAVIGFAPAGGRGVEAQTSGNGYGVLSYNTDPAGFAGYFSGRVHVNGTLSKSAGSFKIDHPLDPARKYLSHSFVESPDMLNIYNGNVVLGADGSAAVTMPSYFEALNIEYRYQLTPLGGAAPDLHVAQEIAGNRFVIAGGAPGLKVSWQVTGIRNDLYARENRIQVEEDKAPDEQGKYLYLSKSQQASGTGAALLIGPGAPSQPSVPTAR